MNKKKIYTMQIKLESIYILEIYKQMQSTLYKKFLRIIPYATFRGRIYIHVYTSLYVPATFD